MPASFTDLFCSPILFEPIFAPLDFHTLLNLTNTCTTLRRLTPYIWNINILLKRYTTEVDNFRHLMRKYEAIISGSTALGFFMKLEWEGSDLDLYVQSEVGLRSFANLLQEDGYKFVPFAWQARGLEDAIEEREEKYEEIYRVHIGEVKKEFVDSNGDVEVAYDMRGISAVYNFQDPTGRKVQIMLTKRSPLNSIMNSYYSTHVMNIITADRAYSLFPHHTIFKKVGYMTREAQSSKKIRAAIVKYEARGWMISGAPDSFQRSVHGAIRGHRSVGDKYCWTIDFSGQEPLLGRKTKRIELSTFGVHPLGGRPAVTFPFYYSDGGTQDMKDDEIKAELKKRRGNYLEISMKEAGHALLQYKYDFNRPRRKLAASQRGFAGSSEDRRGIPWRICLRDCLRKAESRLLEEREREDQDSEGVWSGAPVKYLDDRIFKLYQKWEQRELPKLRD